MHDLKIHYSKSKEIVQNRVLAADDQGEKRQCCQADSGGQRLSWFVKANENI